MTRSDDGEWVGCLVCALGRVDEIEGEYVDELAERRRRREEEDRDARYGITVSDPAGDLRSFYQDVRYSGGQCAEGRYEPLRAALCDAENVLGRHPALAAVLKADDRGEEFVVRALDGNHVTSQLAVIAGVLCRAREVGEDGLSVASCELKSLLDRSLEDKCGSVANILTTGYDISITYGLRLGGEVEIAENVKAVPPEQMEDFLDKDRVRNVVPEIVRGSEWWEGVAAVIKAVPWKPVLFPLGHRTEGVPGQVSSFFDEAWDFVELLSVLQGAPTVCLAVFPDCIHRSVPLLLGEPREGGSMGVNRWAASFDGLEELQEPDDDALEQAGRLFSWEERSRYQEYGPVISRLSAALARTGQYADDDRILDVAIALEQMYELDQGEISFKLKVRAACFLASETRDRQRVFENVEQFYKARSGIVHHRRKESSPESKDEAFRMGFEVARNSIIKLLREGPPRDWNEVVMAGMGNPNPQSIDSTSHVRRAR